MSVRKEPMDNTLVLIFSHKKHCMACKADAPSAAPTM